MLETRAPSLASPGFSGSVLMSDPQHGPRTVTVRGIVEGDTVTALRANEAILKDRLQAGTVGLAVSGRADVEIRARLQSLIVTPGHPPLASLISQVEASLLAYDPYAYDVVPVVVALSAARASCPLGIHPSTPAIRIVNATNPVVTLRGISGEAVATIGVTVTQTADEDYLVIDCGRARVLKYDAGTESDITDDISEGDFFALDPRDGDQSTESWPTLELSSGAGEAVYKRCW